MNATEFVIHKLQESKDEKYKDFHSRLIPTIDKEKIIGVRTPQLKQIAKDVFHSPYKDDFLNALPHQYYDENSVHAFMIMNINDYDETIKRVNEYLPYIDNWANCDQLSPKVFKKHPDDLLKNIYVWLNDEKIYTKRFAVNMLMQHFLDDKFSSSFLEEVANLDCSEYYIMMVVAWYFATALAKQYEEAIKIIESKILDKHTHNKAIQKACESFRVCDEHKAYLKTLRRK